MQAIWFCPLELLHTLTPPGSSNRRYLATLSLASSSLQFSYREAPPRRIPDPCLAWDPRDRPSPADGDPVEVDDYDYEQEGLTKFDKIQLRSKQARKEAEQYYKDNEAVFREAIGLDDDEDDEGREEAETLSFSNSDLANEDGDFFSAVDTAVASMKSMGSASKKVKGLLGQKERGGEEGEHEDEEGGQGSSVRIQNFEDEGAEDFEEEDLAEDDNLEGQEADEEDHELQQEVVDGEDHELQQEVVDGEEDDDVLADPSFDLDFTLQEDLDQIKEPVFHMTLSELLDEARVVPILVDGDQDVEITGIQYDSQQVCSGNMFICCPGYVAEGQSRLAEAIEKGAVVIVASMEMSVQETVKAVVVVEDTISIISSLSAVFYGEPSKRLSVVGVSGTDGKTTTTYILKCMFEAMDRKTGILCSIANYIYGKKRAEACIMNLDAVSLHKVMATMVHNGTDTCVLEVSSHNGHHQSLDFDVAVFTNFRSGGDDRTVLEEKQKESIVQLFRKMVDPKRHAKVVNLDDAYASYLITQGGSDVPVVTYSMENREADVFTVDIQLSLFETDVLIHTPKGNLEISSGLLGRPNVYSILAAVAVGIALDAPLEAIVQGIEEVDAVPGRCELIDEEQAFAVVVDHARTPEALSRLLDTVKECGARRLITVVGCEGECERGKRPIMAKISTDKSDVTILTSDNPRTEDPLYILDDMLAGVGWSMKEYLEHGEKDYYPPLKNGHRLFLYDDRAIAVRAAVAMGEEGDAVVIAGKGHETYQMVGDTKEYLDDREECREALQHVDALHAGGIDTSEFPWRLPESH